MFLPPYSTDDFFATPLLLSALSTTSDPSILLSFFWLYIPLVFFSALCRSHASHFNECFPSRPYNKKKIKNTQPWTYVCLHTPTYMNSLFSAVTLATDALIKSKSEVLSFRWSPKVVQLSQEIRGASIKNLNTSTHTHISSSPALNSVIHDTHTWNRFHCNLMCKHTVLWKTGGDFRSLYLA